MLISVQKLTNSFPHCRLPSW